MIKLIVILLMVVNTCYAATFSGVTIGGCLPTSTTITATGFWSSPYNGIIRGCVKQGDYVIMPSWHGGLVFLDVSTPASPSPDYFWLTEAADYGLGSDYYMRSYACRTATIGGHDYLFVADRGGKANNPADSDVPDGTGKLRAFLIDDMSNIPTSVAEQPYATLYDKGCDLNIYNSGADVFIVTANRCGGFTMIDASDPTSLDTADQYTLLPAAFPNEEVEIMGIGMSDDGDRAYLPNFSKNLLGVDLTGRFTTPPTFTAGTHTVNLATDPWLWDCAYKDDYLFVSAAQGWSANATESLLYVFDVSDDAGYTVSQTFNLGHGGKVVADYSPFQVEVSGEYVFVGNGELGLEVFDATDVTSVKHKATIKIRDTNAIGSLVLRDVWGAFVDGSYLYIIIHGDRYFDGKLAGGIVIVEWSAVTSILTNNRQVIFVQE